MPRLSRHDAASVRAIGAELDTIHVDGPPVLDVVMPELRGLLGTESVLAYKVSERATGWQVDIFHHDGFRRAAEFGRRLLAFLATAPARFAWYNAVRPEPGQRNRVLEAVGRIPPGQYETSPLYRDVMAPLGLERHTQLRVLVCDGPALLAWVGTFHPGPVRPGQHRLLAAVVPALRRRLTIEQRLHSAPRTQVALEAALDHIAAPTFVVDHRGGVHETNAAARALLSTRYATVIYSLRDAVARRPSELTFELTPLRENGSCVAFLAVLSADTLSERIAGRVMTSAARWSLTPRQHQVIELVAQGMANATIAATLGIGERAVELHVSAILDRAGVESRAALIARILSA